MKKTILLLNLSWPFLLMFAVSCLGPSSEELKKKCYHDDFNSCEKLLDPERTSEEKNYGFKYMMSGCKQKYLKPCLFLIDYYNASPNPEQFNSDRSKVYRQACKIGHTASCSEWEKFSGKKTLNVN